MLTLSLKSLRFSACYGLYPQEQIQPNDFEVDISVSIPADAPDGPPMLDYQTLHDAAAHAFATPPEPQTLEKLLAVMYDFLRSRLPENSRTTLAVRKLKPALGAGLDWAEVRFETH